MSRRSKSPAPGDAGLAAAARADGIRLELLDGVLDVIAAVSECERLDEERDGVLARIGTASNLYWTLQDPDLIERIERLEDRTLEWLLAPVTVTLPSDDAVIEWAAVEGRISDGALIARCDSRAPRVGVAWIGSDDGERVLPVCLDGERVSASGRWRALPVGCLVRSEAAEPERARIGRSVIESTADGPPVVPSDDAEVLIAESV